MIESGAPHCSANDLKSRKVILDAPQINQADLKYVNPAAREAAGGARAAIGADYEMQLRSEAGPMPAKLAKRKHQISSLYHHAKIRVRHSSSCAIPV